MKTKERFSAVYAQNKAFDVVCLGGVTADIVTRTVDQLPGQGKLALIDTVQLYPGGCAGNSALALAKIGLRAAVIGKIGARGCYIKNRDGETHAIPSYRVPVVDTTGAGDSFAAGFLAGIVQGWDLERCGRFANAVGAHCVMALGATAGIKPMRDIIAFMKSSRKRGL